MECSVTANSFARAKTAAAVLAAATLRLLVVGAFAALAASPGFAQSVRIKDIADVEGVRDNQLVGYGLVVGLAGTGDQLRTAIFTRQSLVGMLERLGVNTRDNELKLNTRNVAAVVVTANLPPFARPGSRIEIAVSTLGDSTNLQGGILLVTPLLGADGEVYAVAQGAVATSAVAVRGAAASVQRGVPTSARIASGAIVEREIPYALAGRTSIEVDDQAERRLGVLRGGVSLQELVRGLNALGVGPRDLISILQPIKAAGALQAELELR